MDARTGRQQKRISKRQEEKTAAELGGRTQANSGATRMGGGGDVRVRGKVRCECKFTFGERYTLKLSELDKLRKQANSAAEQPVLKFEFRSHGAVHCHTAYAVTFGIEDVPHGAPCKAVQTTANQANFYERDLGEVFTVQKNDSVIIQFLDEKETWCKSFRIRPWAKFVEEQGEEDA